jgi:hypothetical protein
VRICKDDCSAVYPDGLPGVGQQSNYSELRILDNVPKAERQDVALALRQDDGTWVLDSNESELVARRRNVDPSFGT